MKKKEALITSRTYKDGIFRLLFSDTENLLSLYNAVSGLSFDTKNIDVQLRTLEDAIFIKQKTERRAPRLS